MTDTTNIAFQLINRNSISQRDSNYWRRRRKWWARYKARIGCDWPGINQTQIEVADYLASLRKRRRS
jgi:hypothetical protein